jgi:hypothetical protein
MDFAAGPDGVEQAVDLALGRDGFDPSMSQAAIKVLGHFWNTDLAKYILNEPRPIDFREQGFRLNLPGDDAAVSLELIGQMDLALVWPDGRSLVVDYKVTDKLDINKYVYQLGLYALAMSKVLPGAGQTPGTAICVLNQQGAELVSHSFSEQDLAFWEREALRAAQGMARINAVTDPRSLEPPVPERCGDCVLASLCGK